MVTLAQIGRIRSSVLLPSLPGVSSRIRSAIADPTKTTLNVGAIVDEDPSLAARVVGFANSPHYGVREPVTSIEQACGILGSNTIYDLSLQAELMGFYDGLDPKTLGDAKTMWVHAIATGRICTILGSRFLTHLNLAQDQHDGLYTVGLIHDLGMFSMFGAFRAAYVELTQLLEHDAPILQMREQQMFGFSHTEVGAVIGHILGLPGDLVDAIENHHLPAVRIRNQPLTLIVSLADTVVSAALSGTTVREELLLVPRYLGLKEGTTIELVELAREEIRELAA